MKTIFPAGASADDALRSNHPDNHHVPGYRRLLRVCVYPLIIALNFLASRAGLVVMDRPQAIWPSHPSWCAIYVLTSIVFQFVLVTELMDIAESCHGSASRKSSVA